MHGLCLPTASHIRKKRWRSIPNRKWIAALLSGDGGGLDDECCTWVVVHCPPCLQELQAPEGCPRAVPGFGYAGPPRWEPTQQRLSADRARSITFRPRLPTCRTLTCTVCSSRETADRCGCPAGGTVASREEEGQGQGQRRCQWHQGARSRRRARGSRSGAARRRPCAHDRSDASSCHRRPCASTGASRPLNRNPQTLHIYNLLPNPCRRREKPREAHSLASAGVATSPWTSDAVYARREPCPAA